MSDEVLQLRQQVSDLAGAMSFVRELKDRPRSTRLDPSPAQDASTIVPSPASSSQREGIPKEPQFVGPTRSAFGFMIGERSLTRMGIPTYETLPASGAQSPANLPRELDADPRDYWHHCTAQEIVRLLTVFQEEVESVYPFINIGDQASRADDILRAIRSTEPGGQRIYDISDLEVSSKDIDIVKVAMATAIVLETHGKKETSTMIVQSVENNVSMISRPEVDIKEVQLITMLVTNLRAPISFLGWLANIFSRVFITSTATKNFSPGAPSALPHEKLLRWVSIGRKVYSIISRILNPAALLRESFGVFTYLIAVGALAPVSLSHL